MKVIIHVDRDDLERLEAWINNRPTRDNAPYIKFIYDSEDRDFIIDAVRTFVAVIIDETWMLDALENAKKPSA